MSGHGAINSIEVSRIPLPGRRTESFEFRASGVKVPRCARNLEFFALILAKIF
jgi:hypothetical protein